MFEEFACLLDAGSAGQGELDYTMEVFITPVYLMCGFRFPKRNPVEVWVVNDLDPIIELS
jgi:hypothetical protein